MQTIRVTEPLSIWFRDATQGVNPALIDAAAERGTAAHSYFAAHCQNLFVPALPEEIQGYFESFKTWFDKYVDHVFFVEQEMTDEALGLVGHSDAGLRLVDGRVVIVDWKTPVAESKTWGPQISAYLHLAKKNRPEKYVGCMALQPKRDGGTAKATVYQYSDEMFAIYSSALNCYRYFKG
jgi:hypothetical protein